MKFQPFAFVVLASWLDLCSAWGTLGHETIAYIASNFGEEYFPWPEFELLADYFSSH